MSGNPEATVDLQASGAADVGLGFLIAYALGRNEVWRWYWRAWRRRLWMFHLLLVVLIAAEFYAASPKASLVTGVPLPTLICALPAISLMVAYPQLRFKPETRTVTLTGDGLDTTIKGKSRKYSWGDIRSVTELNDYVILKNRKMIAFIVPPRTFASPDDRDTFADFVKKAVAATKR
jgi:hypothetical protein